MPAALVHDADSTPRLLATLLRELLRDSEYDSLADLKEDLKCRAARLRIPYDTTVIAATLDLVESNRPLVRDRLLKVSTPVEPVPYPTPPQATAAAVLRELLRRTPHLRGRHRWPKKRGQLTPEDVERFKTENGLITHGHRPAHVAPLPAPRIAPWEDDEECGDE